MGDHSDELLDELLAPVLAKVKGAIGDSARAQLAALCQSADVEKAPDQLRCIEAVAVDQIAGGSLNVQALCVAVEGSTEARRFIARGILEPGPASRMAAEAGLWPMTFFRTTLGPQ